jgi:arginase family enzyme
MSRLRAKCPFCKTMTAVALGPEYECHACGRTFAAGLVRVPRAWGSGGESMAEAAWLPLPYPETAVVEADTLAEQTLALASDLPDRPLVLGGCCTAHIGAVEGLAARHDRLAVAYVDAHGDLNTSETSRTGNAWGMALRAIVDSGAVEAGDVALVGTRNLDPAEEEFLADSDVRTGPDALERATEAVDCVYVALDVDVLDPAEASMFFPEPDGPTVAELEALLRGLAARRTVVGMGLSGMRADDANLEPATRLAAAALQPSD